MPYQESGPLTPVGARSAPKEGAITRAGSFPRQNSTSAGSLVDSDRALPSFVHKATVVLNDELKSIASLGTEVLGEASLSGPLGIEPATERFREQARKLVDTFVEMLEHRPEHLTQFAFQGAGVGGPHSGDDRQSVPLLKPPPPVSSGQAGCIVLSLENDDPDETVECALYTTDLVGSSGHRIPAAHVNMSPIPVRIPPGGSTEVRIEIRVPRGTPPGSYAGLLQVNDGSLEQAVLQLSVGS